MEVKEGKLGPNSNTTSNLWRAWQDCSRMSSVFARRGIQTLPSASTHGAKYLVDVSEVSDASVDGLPKDAVKLAKGVGVEITRLSDPSDEIRMTAAYPSWAGDDDLRKALAKADWISKVEDFKRVKLCEGLVKSNYVDFTITPHRNGEIEDVTIGEVRHLIVNVSELFDHSKWSWELEVSGHTVCVSRTISCSFCGRDDHHVNGCYMSLRTLAR